MARKFQRHRNGAESDLLTRDPLEHCDDEFEAALREMEFDFADLDSHRGSASRPTAPPTPLPPSWLLPSADEPGPKPAPSPIPVRSEFSHTPWEVHSFRKAFSLFGPMLSVLAAAQTYTAWALGRLAAGSEFKRLDLQGLPLAAVIALFLFALDAVFLRIHLGKHQDQVAVWVAGLTLGSGIFALSCHVALRCF